MEDTDGLDFIPPDAVRNKIRVLFNHKLPRSEYPAEAPALRVFRKISNAGADISVYHTCGLRVITGNILYRGIKIAPCFPKPPNPHGSST